MIDDREARLIASEWHGGMWSALYALSSTGAILSPEADDDDLTRADAEGEIEADLSSLAPGASPHAWPEAERPELRADLAELLAYVREHGPRGPQPGWSADVHF